jgi:ribonuclease D
MIPTGEILRLREQDVEWLRKHGMPVTPVSESEMTEKQKRERRVNRRDSKSRLGKIATAMRNDPCPCGSGKKYKKCCLDAPDTKALLKQLKERIAEVSTKEEHDEGSGEGSV